MKKKKANKMYIGAIIIGLGIYFNNWFGAIGLIPYLFYAVDWLHGLFTHHEMHLQK